MRSCYQHLLLLLYMKKIRKGSNLLYFTRVENVFVFMFSFKLAQNLRNRETVETWNCYDLFQVASEN